MQATDLFIQHLFFTFFSKFIPHLSTLFIHNSPCPFCICIHVGQTWLLSCSENYKMENGVFEYKMAEYERGDSLQENIDTDK